MHNCIRRNKPVRLSPGVVKVVFRFHFVRVKVDHSEDLLSEPEQDEKQQQDQHDVDDTVFHYLLSQKPEGATVLLRAATGAATRVNSANRIRSFFMP